MKKRIFLVILLIILVGGEFALRHFIGLTQAPLYFESDKYEYMVLKTVDIRSPKTVISVHFSSSKPMAMQIY